MKYDEDKVADMVLALMYLNMWDDEGYTRAWKGFPWSATDRLYEKGYISDPKGKAKSVGVSEEGRKRAEELFRRYFAVGEE